MNAILQTLSPASSREIGLKRLAITLALFKDYIAIQKGAYLLDSGKLSEVLMEDLLTKVGPWGKLKTLGHRYPNHPAIDLVSADGKIGIQVTSSSSLAKIKDTIEKFLNLNDQPEELFVLMICGREKSYGKASINKSLGASNLKFDPDKNVLTLPDIYNYAAHKPAAVIEDIVQKLEEELSGRAMQLLQRFNASADRVLKVLTVHGASPPLINEMLGLDPSTDVAEVLPPHRLQPLLTSRSYELIAKTFNVPVDWLSNKNDLLAKKYESSQWRGEGVVSDLIAGLLIKHKSVHFKIVLPMEPGGASNDTHTPVLVFYEAKGENGKVCGHLGIQAWNVPHHRKAALYLGTVVRHLNLTEGLPIGVSWWHWPRELIMETTSDLLLVEALQHAPKLNIDETLVIDMEEGKWRFAMEPLLEKEFNESYAPTVKEQVLRRQKQVLHKDSLGELFAEEIARFSLPPLKKRKARVFGREAFAIAKKCKKKVCFVDNLGKVSRMSVEEARKKMDEAPAINAKGNLAKLVYIDVRPG